MLWNTASETARPVSRIGPVLLILFGLLAPAGVERVHASPSQAQPASADKSTTNTADPRALFAKGQTALETGELDAAEAAFRGVLKIDPRSGAAYANLGVVAMRRKDWDQARALLQKAETLDPKMTGIRLNIGLVEFHRGKYAAAVAPLASVLHAQPDSQQARYLLGLCYVFTDRYPEALEDLQPLWDSMSNEVLYLYVYDLAAIKSGKKDLDERILAHMIEVGSTTPEFHLIIGKAYLNRGEFNSALTELQRAEAFNSKLPFLHFNMGLAHARLGEDAPAEAEFRKDIASEPDLPDNYTQLGLLYSRLGRNQDAENAFREALKRDSRMADANFGLAKLEFAQKKNAAALQSIDGALRSDPAIPGGHFLKGRILTQLGRNEEAQKEFTTAKNQLDSGLQKDRQDLEGHTVPNPELKQQP